MSLGEMLECACSCAKKMTRESDGFEREVDQRGEEGDLYGRAEAYASDQRFSWFLRFHRWRVVETAGCHEAKLGWYWVQNGLSSSTVVRRQRLCCIIGKVVEEHCEGVVLTWFPC